MRDWDSVSEPRGIDGVPRELDDADDEDDADEPEEGDYTSSDHQHWYQYGKLVLTVPDEDDHCDALRAHMDREQFWPNAWFVSDHGNAHRINLSVPHTPK